MPHSPELQPFRIAPANLSSKKHSPAGVFALSGAACQAEHQL
jgi:hypothetical protein